MPAGAGTFAETGERSRRCASRETISVSSICASAKPMQLRAPPTERHPGHLGERSSVVVQTDETIGIEAQGFRPGSGIAAREMRRLEDQCALRDAHAAFLTAACKGPEDSLTMYGACTKREDGRGDTGIRSARPRDNCGREGSGPRRTAGEVGRPGAPSDRPIMPDGEHEAALRNAGLGCYPPAMTATTT
jgi:hypothetical protein